MKKNSFSLFLAENEAQDAAAMLADHIKKVSKPEQIKRLLQQAGIDPKDGVDGAIQALENHPKVKQSIEKWEKMKAKQPLQENWLFDAVKFIGNSLKGVLSWAIGSVVNVVTHIFKGFGEGSGKSLGLIKLNYLSLLLLTFGLAPVFLLAGATPSALVWGVSGTSLAAMWIGKNVIEKFIQKAGIA